jgi:hypothetical protein
VFTFRLDITHARARLFNSLELASQMRGNTEKIEEKLEAKTKEKK